MDGVEKEPNHIKRCREWNHKGGSAARRKPTSNSEGGTDRAFAFLPQHVFGLGVGFVGAGRKRDGVSLEARGPVQSPTLDFVSDIHHSLE